MKLYNSTMAPGRELDALVAEKVMGFRQTAYGQWYDRQQRFLQQGCPQYSADIAAAWDVLGMFASYEVSKTGGRSTVSVGGYRFAKTHGGFCLLRGFCLLKDIESEPYAICIAALKAVGAIV